MLSFHLYGENDKNERLETQRIQSKIVADWTVMFVDECHISQFIRKGFSTCTRIMDFVLRIYFFDFLYVQAVPMVPQSGHNRLLSHRHLHTIHIHQHPSRAGLRHVGSPDRLIIWRHFKPIFFKLFLPKAGLAKV